MMPQIALGGVKARLLEFRAMRSPFQPPLQAVRQLIGTGIAVLAFLAALPAPGQTPAALAPGRQAMAGRLAAADVLDVAADSLAYDASGRFVVARGNVKITSGQDSVSADFARVDTIARTVHARGNIVIHYRGNIWQGEEATYDFQAGTGDFGAFTASSPPWHITARDSRLSRPNRVELDGVMLTTCEPDRPEYSIRAASGSLEDNNILRAKHLRFQLGPVPFFYVPYLRANLEELAKFEFTPGYSSSMGAFLLTAYNQPLNDVFRSRTHFDVRSRRGIGLGQDLIWKDRVNATHDGMARAYYAHDNRPWKNEEQRLAREELINKDRYWLQLKDRYNLTDRDYLITELNYVSDPWLLTDFFDDEYQKNVQPENRLTLAHRDNRYTAGVGLNMRLNDFYGNVNRLPEAFLNFNRQQIFETPFYYEGANTLSYLERVYPSGSPRDKYDAFRFDSYNMVYWPTRHFGFLSLIPRAGYRGTYYSKTLSRTTVTNIVTVTNDLGEVIGTTNQVATLLSEGGATWRNLPEIGLAASFKAFGNLYRGPTGLEDDEDLRHIAEPYADYTLRFEPNTLPEDLWQFDGVDKLDYANALFLGMRNYLQTKRRGAAHNLIYADVFTTLNMDPDDDEERLGNIGFKTEWRPWSWLTWDFDGIYDTLDDRIHTFHTSVGVRAPDHFNLNVDYRYKYNTRDVIAGDLEILPEQRWSGRLYARLNLDDSELEEHSYMLIHRTRCLGIGLGLRIRPNDSADGEDNYTVWLRLWPLAFPGFSSSLGG
jgi:LPS-assembly protein